MKRTLFLFIILLIGTGGCSDKETPTPEETNQETENYRIIKLGDDFPIKVGEKVLIKDTLFVYDSTERGNGISPVYLNYLLTLDSLKDYRLPLEGCPYSTIYIYAPARAYFSFLFNNEHFSIDADMCLTPMDSICNSSKLVNCAPLTLNNHYISATNNAGICLTLCYVSPHPDSLNPHPQQSEYTAYLVVNPVIK